MDFYKLGYDFENSEGYISCTAKELYGFDQYDVDKGQELTSWDERITFEYDPAEGEQASDVLSNNLGWLIVSEKFRLLLSAIGVTGIQYLPVRIVNKSNGSFLTGYSVMNILNLVDALDLNNSKYEEWDLGEEEKFLSIEVHSIKEKMVMDLDLHVFKLVGDPLPRFVSGKIREVVEKNGITGCEFIGVRTS